LGNLNYAPLTDINYFKFESGAIAGNEIIRVTDSAGQISEAFITITADLDLQISPTVAQVLSGGADYPFSASGGSGVYVFSIDSPKTLPLGDSSINSDNGRYSPPITDTGVETIRVTDSSIPTPLTAVATIYIVDALLTINPSVSLTLHIGDKYTFSASNGTVPYFFSIGPGDAASASINSETGLFEALGFDASVLVTVTDSKGTSDTCRVKILK
ncbi:MAG: hypothetical protein KAR21_27265, partial [Spirochaetales bacterium]|nr:hypothetical protein [Spirochaetales bacterium]